MIFCNACVMFGNSLKNLHIKDSLQSLFNDKNSPWQKLSNHTEEMFVEKMPYVMCFYHLQLCTIPNLFIPAQFQDLEQMLTKPSSCVGNPWKGTEHQIMQHVFEQIYVLYYPKWELPVEFYFIDFLLSFFVNSQKIKTT